MVVEGLGETVARVTIGRVLLLQHIAQLIELIGARIGVRGRVVVPAYASIRDVPGPVDLAVISITVDGVEQALRDCAAAGVRAAMIVTAQFAESGPEGAA